MGNMVLPTIVEVQLPQFIFINEGYSPTASGGADVSQLCAKSSQY